MIRASLSFSRRMFASQKAATGLVGLPVADDGIAELKEVSTNILQQIQVCPSNLSNCAISSFYFRLFIFLKTFTLQGSVATRMSLRALSLMAACLCVMSCCLLSWPTATLYSPRILFFFRFFIIYLIISPFSGSWKLTLLVLFLFSFLWNNANLSLTTITGTSRRCKVPKKRRVVVSTSTEAVRNQHRRVQSGKWTWSGKHRGSYCNGIWRVELNSSVRRG